MLQLVLVVIVLNIFNITFDDVILSKGLVCVRVLPGSFRGMGAFISK